MGFQKYWFVVALLLPVLHVFALVHSEATDNDIKAINYRLPGKTRPETYQISIVTRIDLAIFDFSGNVKINIIVEELTREIVLHAKQIVINNLTLWRLTEDNYTDIKLLPYETEEATQFLIIKTDGIDLNVGDKLMINIGYNGVLGADANGFFRSFYENFDESILWLAATKFQPTYARQAFPCYDEPSFKAKFTIVIHHGKRYNAISNMPETRVENVDDTATTSFLETPPMSTYLLAFIISDFPYRTNTNNPMVFRHRVYSPPSAVGMSRLGLQNAELLLHALERYLQLNFSLPKMDQVAVPGFGPSAVENWGLVMYREDNLLYDMEAHNFTRVWDVVHTIARELSQQYFGNRVSSKWWTYQWLSEGLANLFQQIIIEMVYPQWNVFQYYLANTVHSSLEEDALGNAQPMSYPVDTPEGINNLFDDRSYGKSGSVLRMFQHAITDDSFKKGLNYYITDFSHKSTDENDLFASLQKSVKEDLTLEWGLNIATLFSSWSRQEGFPLLTVARNYKLNQIDLDQERYYNPANGNNDTTVWWIPYNYVSGANPNFNRTAAIGWLNEKSATIISAMFDSDDWIIFNVQQTSFYRILYDEINYKLIAKQLNSDGFGAIHVLNRAHLLDDLLEFAEVGRAKVDILFEFLSYLKRETEYVPWVPGRDALILLSRRLAGNRHYAKFCEFAANLTEHFMQSVGLDDVAGESILTKYSRVMAVNLACEFRVEQCLNGTRVRLMKLIEDEDIEPSMNTTSILFTNGARAASAQELELIWEWFLDTVDADNRIWLAEGFGRIERLVLLREYLNRTLLDQPDDLDDRQWRVVMFQSALKNGEHGLRCCIQLLWNNAPEVLRAYKLDNLNGLVANLSERIVNGIIRKEFENLIKYLESKNLIDARAVNLSIAAIKHNLQWINSRRHEIDGWFGVVKSDPSDNNSPSAGYLAHLSIFMISSLVILSIFF